VTQFARGPTIYNLFYFVVLCGQHTECKDLTEEISFKVQTNLSKELQSVVIRFAGDSGDGIQVTGNQFTNESALAGNDISTLPDFPAEIRAPAGTLAGVSGFQINFGSQEIHTPGDTPNVLVAMNPAALKANLSDLEPGGVLIINEDAFSEKNLSRVGYLANPINDESLQNKYQVFSVPITKLTAEALSDSNLSSREIDRSKNFFTLGIMLWMFSRPYEETLNWISTKFAKKPEIAKANITALKAGLAFAEATEIFEQCYTVAPAKLSPGTYRNINGSTALAYGLISASQKSSLPLFFGAYPITPASSLLHELSKHKNYDVTTFQAEDEIAAICAAIGASYAGSLAITSSSGPGISLKAEAMGLACCVELPLVIINVQRGGPSTGLPTKNEQSDLFQALYGRHGESPLCVLAASSPSNAFSLAYEACRIAVKYMTPVILLSDSYVANSAEPWKIPDPNELKEFTINKPSQKDFIDGKFAPYLRNKDTLARAWATPGTPDLMHRVGGLEKQNITGTVCYDGDNHDLMTKLRAEKIERIRTEIPKTVVDGDKSGGLLVIGWGGTEGSITEAVNRARIEGISVSRIHLRHLNPLPSDLGDILKNFSQILIPEINTGQLSSVIRDRYLIDVKGLNIVKGQPLKVQDIIASIKNLTFAH
jgi:2-oxoglutarate ferredoxin oxidoreductase subunit alpha